MTVPIEDTTDEYCQDAELEAAISWHDGDPRAAIRALLEDCRHLREQLGLAKGAISRGWEPNFERLDS